MHHPKPHGDTVTTQLAAKQVLFIQGAGAGTYDAWDNKLVESLQRELGRDYEVRYPRMPHEEDPDSAQWRAAIEREVQSLAAGAVVVGHSAGGATLLSCLCQRQLARPLSGVVVVSAPFMGEGGWSSGDMEIPRDLGAQLPDGLPIHFFHGSQDEVVPDEHLALYARAAPRAHIHGLPGRDHQLDSDMREVANVILSFTS